MARLYIRGRYDGTCRSEGMCEIRIFFAHRRGKEYDETCSKSVRTSLSVQLAVAVPFFL